jgi:hypothetical protein
MNWTRSADLQSQVQKLWDRGELLASALGSTDFFPRRLSLKVPSSSELTARFDEARDWVREIKNLSHYRIEMRSFKHRLLSSNEIPIEVWIDNLDAAVAVIGKLADLACFREMISIATKRQSMLLPWLSNRPLVAIKHADQWNQLLDITDWALLNPRPSIYLRQIDIQGVHSKFIEEHKSVLSEMLDIVMPPQCINNSATGIARFESRYGFKEKPSFIRLRTLDSSTPLLLGTTQVDLSLDSISFAALNPKVNRVFITENEVNFLSLPTLPSSLAIFGKGYGWETLAKATWLQDCEIYYWGDIDTHGFAILDQLRAYLPHTKSILMDRDTLLHFKHLWGEELQPVNRKLTRLTSSEFSLYEELCTGSLRANIRLEQEHIGFSWTQNRLKNLP